MNDITTLALMPVIKAPYLEVVDCEASLREMSASLDKLVPNIIGASPWPAKGIEPHTSFVIAHTGNSILLKYYVHEKTIRGVHGESNANVYEDSCVEFFISFDGDKAYYNFEMNCIATCLLGHGETRENRQLLSENVIRKIKRHVVIEPVVVGNEDFVYWELILNIPLEVFVHNSISNLKASRCKVNFYKCGDQLPEPHYLTWNNITSIEPNFHLPEFFGELRFV